MACLCEQGKNSGVPLLTEAHENDIHCNTPVNEIALRNSRHGQHPERDTNLHTIVITSITDRKQFSVNYFLQYLTGSLPENMPSK